MTLLAVGVGAFLSVYNNVLNIRPPSRWLYVGVNLTVTAGLLAAARGAGLNGEQLGLGAAGALSGLAWGAAAVAVVAAGYVLALARPSWRRRLADRRLAGHGRVDLAVEVLVRIPLGTVALEEVAFRGVLYGAAAAAWSPATGVVVSSAVFGLWHVMPTRWLLRHNWPGATSRQRALATAAGVLVTAVGGVALCWLRIASGSLLAPLMAHTATNAVGAVAAFTALRRDGRSQRARRPTGASGPRRR